jgi:hypothetical protein
LWKVEYFLVDDMGYFLMLNQELSSESGYSITDEIYTLVTGQALGTPKLSNDVLKNKLGHYICREIPNEFFFIPMGEKVCSSDDILFLQLFVWRVDRSYKINFTFPKILRIPNMM